jgi:hypothetical protein
MKTKRTNNIVHRLIIATLLIVFHVILLGEADAKPLTSPGQPFSFPGGKRGLEAITALEDRLPEVASRYGKSAEKLKKTFLHDKDLWLDRDNKLLYLCRFDIAAADTLPEPVVSTIPSVPLPLDQTFLLHSLPGASRVIFLDFDGHVTSGTVVTLFPCHTTSMAIQAASVRTSWAVSRTFGPGWQKTLPYMI